MDEDVITQETLDEEKNVKDGVIEQTIILGASE
jgi:hypothetical protein